MATPLPKIASKKPTTQGGGLLDYVVKGIENAAGQATNAITSGVNATGKIIGNQPFLPQSPVVSALNGGKSVGPSNASVYDQTIGQIPNAPGGDILHGQGTPMSMLGLVTMGMSGGENPEDTATTDETAAEEGTNGGKYTAPEANVNPNLKPATVKANAGKNPINLNYTPPNAGNGSPQYAVEPGQTPLPKIGPAQSVQPQLAPTQEQPSAQTISPIIAKPPVRGVDEVGQPGGVKIYTKAGINGAAKEQQAQTATDNIPGITANQKYQNMNRRMSELSQQIQDYNAANPKQISSATLRNNFMGKISHLIAPDGTTEAEAEKTGQVTQDQANILADNFIRQAELKAGVQPSIDPATSQKMYGIDQVTQMKQAENDMTGPLLTKRYNGGDLKPQEQLRIAGRDAYDTTIGDAQPQIKKLSLEQSGLYDSVDSLDDARKQEDKETFKAANTTGPTFGQKVGGLLKNPIVDVTLGGLLGGGGMSQIGKVIPASAALLESGIQHFTNPSQNQGNTNNSKNQTDHSQSISNYDPSVNTPNDIPQTQDKLKQNAQGGYGIANIYSMKDPTDGSNLFISGLDAKAQQKSINDAKNSTLYANSQTERLRVQKLQDNLDNQTKFTSQIQDDYNSASTKNNAYNQAIVDAKAAGPTLQNFNGTFDDFIKQISPQYADLATQLKTLEQEGAINPNGFIKGSTLLPALQTASAGSLMKFYSKLSTVTGYTGQGTSGIQTPPTSQVTPSSSMPTPKVSFYRAPTGNQMPAMPNFQQIGSSFAQ